MKRRWIFDCDASHKKVPFLATSSRQDVWWWEIAMYLIYIKNIFHSPYNLPLPPKWTENRVFTCPREPREGGQERFLDHKGSPPLNNRGKPLKSHFLESGEKLVFERYPIPLKMGAVQLSIFRGSNARLHTGETRASYEAKNGGIFVYICVYIYLSF